MLTTWKEWMLPLPARESNRPMMSSDSKSRFLQWPVLLGAAATVTAATVSAYAFANYWYPYLKKKKKQQGVYKRKATRDILLMTADLPCYSLLVKDIPSWLQNLEDQFHVSSTRLEHMTNTFIHEMAKGLMADGQSLKMLPAFITRLPSGNEKGRYLAMDVGGSNVRVIEVVLEGNRKLSQKHKKFVIDDTMKAAKGTVLFDFFASCMAEFLQSINGNTQGSFVMGFTFSFPTDQKQINSGKLISWTKGFSCAGVEGHDVVELMHQAFKRKGLTIRIVTLANDTIGTMMAQAYTDPRCKVGVIIGTGTNAAYMESRHAVQKLSGSHSPEVVRSRNSQPMHSPVAVGDSVHANYQQHQQKRDMHNGTGAESLMAINMEWGDFDRQKQSLPYTMYDDQLDKATKNPGQQLFEKMISGLYLGEIARLVLLDLVRKKHLFKGELSQPLQTTESMTTAHMSQIENDLSKDLRDVDYFLRTVLQVRHSSFFDRQVVQLVCEWVSTRAARLSAMSICALLMKIGALSGVEKTTVAMDGAVFEQYPYFAQRMRYTFKELVGMLADQIHLVLSKDGSGLGAALCAAMV